MKTTHDGPLYDAARQLRKAARLIDIAADLDDAVTYATVEATRKVMARKLMEARANIDAAMARLAPYVEGGK